MFSLQQIESDLVDAMKARQPVVTAVLRALKTRVQNEQIAKARELSESEFFSLIQSEIKRRKEAAESFQQGNRPLLAEKELEESAVLSGYLPPQVSETEISDFVNNIIIQKGLTAKDFGNAMGLLKEQFGSSAEGAVLAKVLKEKLK